MNKRCRLDELREIAMENIILMKKLNEAKPTIDVHCETLPKHNWEREQHEISSEPEDNQRSIQQHSEYEHTSGILEHI